MYTLKCSYYKKSFNNIDDLLNDIISTGMDPNYQILYVKNGVVEKIGKAIDLIQF
jgi:hypothetical protein